VRISSIWSISPDLFRNKVINRNGKLGEDACKIMAAAINAVNPYQCVNDAIKVKDQVVSINGHDVNKDAFDRIFILGFGKAAVPMAESVTTMLGENIESAVVITKDQRFLAYGRKNKNFNVLLGGHPIPTIDSIHSTLKLLNGLPAFTENDLVFVLISGGGSALFTRPVEGVTLENLKCMTELLLACGASIQEINTLRKHLDTVKGGGLLRWLHPARVETLILSDVIGDRLDMIASGPTVPDPTTFQGAMQVLDKYDLLDRMPGSIIQHLKDGINQEVQETIKPGDIDIANVRNHLVGTNNKAARAASDEAEILGYRSIIISTHLTGRTEHVSEYLGGLIESIKAHGEPAQSPGCLILGGETTVEIKGDGLGGRNQDLALHMVEKMKNLPGVLFISVATDGEDGPTDAAGAVVDHLVFSESVTKEKIELKNYIENNDSYHFFKQSGGLIKSGATGTNVNDLVLILFESR